jgi:phosphatidylglycerophosphate synthase
MERGSKGSPAAARIPWALVWFRVAAGPVLVAGAWLEWPAVLLAALMALAFASDVFDGIIARRLSVSTPSLRVADSNADVLFYLCVLACVWHLRSASLWSVRWAFLALVVIQTASWVLDRVRFGRSTALHSYTAKAWGITLFAAAIALICAPRPEPFLWLALAMGYVSNAEDIPIKLILPSWHCDVGSFRHALRIRARECSPSRPVPKR